MEPFSKQQLADFLGVKEERIDRGDTMDVVTSYLESHGYNFVFEDGGRITAYRDGAEISPEEMAELLSACRNERPL